MLEMPELWSALLVVEQDQDKNVTVNRAEEHFDIRHGVAEFGVCPAGSRSCFGPVFPHYAPFCMVIRNGNVYPVPLYVRRT